MRTHDFDDPECVCSLCLDQATVEAMQLMGDGRRCVGTTMCICAACKAEAEHLANWADTRHDLDIAARPTAPEMEAFESWGGEE